MLGPRAVLEEAEEGGGRGPQDGQQRWLWDRGGQALHLLTSEGLGSRARRASDPALGPAALLPSS